jgi:hypothetical protein
MERRGAKYLNGRMKFRGATFTVHGLINGNQVIALIHSGCKVECVLSIQCVNRVGIAHR